MEAIKKILWIIFILCCILTIYTEGRKSLHMVYSKVESDYSRKYISNYTAEVSGERQIINMTVSLIKNITADIWFKSSLAQRDATHGYKNMFSYNVNACQLMRAGSGFSLIHVWIDKFYKVSNLPRGCPIKEGDYYWTIMPDKSAMPKFIKPGFYRISALYYVRDWHNDFLINSTIYGDLKMK